MKSTQHKEEKEKTPSIKKSLSIATAIMMGSVFLSRITGLVREMVLARYGGTGYQMDAYVTSFLIPEILNHFLAGGFLSVTFIPIFQKYLVKKDNVGAWKTFSNLFSCGSVLFLILIPITIIFTPQLLSFQLASNGNPQTAQLTVRLTRIILPAQLLFYWGAFFMAVQYAHNRYFLPALSPLCYNLGIIAGGVFLQPHLGIEGFAWGVLGGAFIGNVVIQLPGAIKCGLRYRPLFKPLDPEFINYVKKTIPLVLGLGMAFSNEIFFRFFGSFLDDGATASVNFALRTMMFIVALFGQASGVAFYPYLTRLAAEKAYNKMADLLNKVLKNVALYLIPLSALMIVLSPQIITILFERGNFTAQSTSQVAPVLSIYLVGAFGYSASFIISRSFYALQNTILPMAVSTTVAVISIPLYIAFSTHLGAQGLALAATTAMFLQFGFLYFFWLKRFGGYSKIGAALRTLLKICFATLGGVVLSVLILRFFPEIQFIESRTFESLLIATVVTIPSITAVFIFYELLGLQNLRDSVTGFLKRK
ncbi:murein biosynthesis integral membrane protein MurJ [Chitinispirillales bacterium ANBcel5]|uniref:murein biosynthesis integral membrane protein MurJ n=1 Tax=Cellulosispirillum alkaliphilum TaxID=3039283 RepID=UPI002A53F530|nr:murein biosynthesis integral membrane protein MurJ [Chitinispirillales bacterium ANBcel5]